MSGEVSELNFQIRRPRPAVAAPPQGSFPAECASLLENRGALRVLDIGCGRARFRQFLTGRGHAYVGADLGARRADLHCDMHALPFADSQFDAALLFAVLQYTLRPRLVLEEAHRVIRPAGTLTGCVAFLEPAVWGGLMHLSAEGLAGLLAQADFRLEYLWPSWSVLEAVAGAMRQSDPQPGVLKEVERALESCPDAFRDTLDFSGAIYFHAVKPAPTRHSSGNGYS